MAGGCHTKVRSETFKVPYLGVEVEVVGVSDITAVGAALPDGGEVLERRQAELDNRHAGERLKVMGHRWNI
jgi:hypothetical protein